jgi:hypothetical protein
LRTGAGGCDSVNLYLINGTHQLRAIKTAHPGKVSNLSRPHKILSDFTREVSILYMNAHPTIVQVLNYGVREFPNKFDPWMELEFIPVALFAIFIVHGSPFSSALSGGRTSFSHSNNLYMRAVNTSPKKQFLKLPLNKPNEYFEKLMKVTEHNGTVFDLKRSIVTSHKDVTHFLLVWAQKESLSPRARKMQSKYLFVCALTTKQQPMELFQYSLLKGEWEKVISICLDPCSYLYMTFFMNHVTFHLDRTEFLETIVKCRMTYDENLSFVTPKRESVDLKVADPSHIEERHLSGFVRLNSHQRSYFSSSDHLTTCEVSPSILLTDSAPTASSGFDGSISEPKSVS